jgi:hypothetical protein
MHDVTDPQPSAQGMVTVRPADSRHHFVEVACAACACATTVTGSGRANALALAHRRRHQAARSGVSIELQSGGAPR